MQLICVCFHNQCLKFYYEIGCILLFLFESLYLPFSICSLGLVTKYYLNFLYKLALILGSYFFIQLIKLFLGINAYYTLSKVDKNHSDPIIYFHDSVALQKQFYSSPLVLKFVLSLLNHPRSRTMFFGNPVCPLFS